MTEANTKPPETPEELFVDLFKQMLLLRAKVSVLEQIVTLNHHIDEGELQARYDRAHLDLLAKEYRPLAERIRDTLDVDWDLDF